MENGWDLFGIDTYYMKIVQQTENWRLSSVNKEYKVIEMNICICFKLFFSEV